MLCQNASNMRITVIYCGDHGAEYFNSASKEYEKSISAFSEIDVVKIRPEPLDENKNLSQNVIDKALETEADKILSVIPKGA